MVWAAVQSEVEFLLVRFGFVWFCVLFFLQASPMALASSLLKVFSVNISLPDDSGDVCRSAW